MLPASAESVTPETSGHPLTTVSASKHCPVPFQPPPFTLLLGALGAEWLQEAGLIDWYP